MHLPVSSCAQNVKRLLLLQLDNLHVAASPATCEQPFCDQGACDLQDAKAFMVAWKGGRQVADVPCTKLNLPPGSWLGLTTAAALAAALLFARTHTKALEDYFNEVGPESAVPINGLIQCLWRVRYSVVKNYVKEGFLVTDTFRN